MAVAEDTTFADVEDTDFDQPGSETPVDTPTTVDERTQKINMLLGVIARNRDVYRIKQEAQQRLDQIFGEMEN